mmetsp:Transcript_22758/g.65589  ORF Transcript_22758/g.65589 Transcript_22758/m.65589 type:complete len:629 (+) Transcript_22758:199-2085(+)
MKANSSARSTAAQPPGRRHSSFRERETSSAGFSQTATRRATDLTAMDDDSISSPNANASMDAAFFREVVGRTLQSFSPTDPAYQLHDEYPPDKMASWNKVFPEGLHLYSGNLANRAHLKEATDMHNALGAVVKRMVEQKQPLHQWCIDSIQAWYWAHRLWTSRRVQVFRSYFLPVLKSRFVVPTVFVQSLDILEEQQVRIASMVALLRPEDGLAAASRLYDAWTEYVEYSQISMMLYTDVGYILLMSYFSIEEAQTLQKSNQIYQKMATNSFIVGAIVDYAGIDVCRDVVLPTELGKVAAEVAWNGVISKAYKVYLAQVAVYLEVLEFHDARLLRAYEDMGWDPHEEGVLLSQDPADPSYLLPENPYRPFHLAEWEVYSPQHLHENTWALANNAHRVEARMMGEALQGIASRGETLPWIVAAIKSFWKEHGGWVVSRFDVFQNYSLPLLEKRLRYPASFLQAWAAIIKQMENISVLVNDMSPGDAIWTLYDLHDAWAIYEETVTRNLRLQEPVAMILFHAYFSRAEGDKIVKEELRRMSSNSRCLDAMIYHSSSGGDVTIAAKALPSTCSLELEYRRKSYEDNVAAPMRSLKLGRQPRKQKTTENTTIGFARTLFSAMGAGLTKELEN